MKLRPRVVVIGFLLTLVLPVLPAISHPLGKFSIDRYSRLRVTADALTLRYVIDMAEIPSVEERLQADADGDREISTAERSAYLELKLASWLAGVTAALNGTRLDWRTAHSNVSGLTSHVPRADGSAAPTLRVFMDLRAEFPAALSGRNTITYDDRNYPERTGWKEVVVEAESEVRLLKSSAPHKDLSNELTHFPAERTAPPQDVSAVFSFELRSQAGFIGAVRAVFPPEQLLWVLLIVLAVGLVARWRNQA